MVRVSNHILTLPRLRSVATDYREVQRDLRPKRSKTKGKTVQRPLAAFFAVRVAMVEKNVEVMEMWWNWFGNKWQVWLKRKCVQHLQVHIWNLDTSKESVIDAAWKKGNTLIINYKPKMNICGCMQPYIIVAFSMSWEGNSWAEYTSGFIFIICSSYQNIRKIIRKSLYSNNTASWQGIYLVTQNHDSK